MNGLGIVFGAIVIVVLLVIIEIYFRMEDE